MTLTEDLIMAVKTLRPAPLTDAGRARLSAELNALRNEREPQLAALMHDARSQASAAEEGDYMALQEEIARVQGRIQEIEHSLAAERLDESTNADGVVTVGSAVTARDNAGRTHNFVIVSPVEADAGRGQISSASPIGSALLGKRAGEEVSVQAPAGLRTFTLLQVA